MNLVGSHYAKIAYSNSKADRFLAISTLIFYEESKAPGPGNYQTINNLSNIGKSILSTNSRGGLMSKFA